MMYDLATFLLWILLALVIGGFVGWRTRSDAPRPDWLRSWLLPATLAFAIGVLMALLNVLPGRAGLWLEVALLMVGGYVFGCLIGGQLKDFFGLDDAKAAAPSPPANRVASVADTAAPHPVADSPSQALAAHAAASVEADRLAAEAEAKAETDRLAAEAAAKAEAERLAAEATAKAEAQRLAAEAAAKAEAERLAAEDAAKAEADRLAAEAAAKAEAERLAAEAAAKAEAERLAAEAAAKAEAERLAAEAAAKAEAERLAAEAAAKAEAERLAAEAAARAEAERLAAEAAAKAEADRLAAEAAAKAEADRLAAEAEAETEAEAEAERVAAEAAAEAEADRLAAEVAASAPLTTAAADDRPPALPAPDGTADDLKLLKGIGPKNERILNDIGVYHFSQIAEWSPAHASWVGDHMAFPGRIEREHWIAQAKLLAAGFDTAHSTAVKSGAITIDDQADAPLSEDEANALGAQLPVLMPKVENEDKYAGARPLGLAAPRGGEADDLKLIKGIGKQNEARLHGLGIWHFEQIAAWTAAHAKWVGSYLAFAGRIEREQWIAQAKELASGGSTEFARRVEAGLVKSSRDDGSRGQDNIKIVQPGD
ncbi:cell envelope biogenesis protein TolA [Bradyrhizobium ontarionense]|uniref:Cell envelope biogenesis protein TolA n=1 Tax=Bradyrhizobium ontarionense TaxID=2898149 RepID=A0ABY3RHF4_9BRAD|nr:cell envelope biogenesis protein TolA [Bradyrhizobium sp. A19]UFZ06748.1 cell envelope biogenesis protein TolA [Bradyrhizobium sp. A19]